MHVDTELVGKGLTHAKRRKKAYGTVHALDRGAYPSDRHGLPIKRFATTDTTFKKGSDHLLNGVFRFYYRNGKLRSEYVFAEGYQLSVKDYQRNGELYYWMDYDIDYDGCLFSCFVQHCIYENGTERTIESICTFIDKRLGNYYPNYALGAKRRGYSMK